MSLSLDSDFCLIVFTGSAQLWAGGQHRVRLGKLERSEDSIKVEGLNKRAYWCSSRRLLAILVHRQYTLKACLARSLASQHAMHLYADIQQLPTHLWNAYLQRVHTARCWLGRHARLEACGHLPSAQHCCTVCRCSNIHRWRQPVNLTGLIRWHLPAVFMAGQGS